MQYLTVEIIYVASNGQIMYILPNERTRDGPVDESIPTFASTATVCHFLEDRRCGRPKEQLREAIKCLTRSQDLQVIAIYLPVLI